MFLRCMSLLMLLWTSVTNAEYLFTMPSVMEAEKDTYYCLRLADIQLPPTMMQDSVELYDTDIRIEVTNQGSNETRSAHYVTSTVEKDLHMCSAYTPPASPGRYRMEVEVTMKHNQNSFHVFNKSNVITVSKPDLITLVQTDKPIYKPGQVVMFRVMTMDYTLMADTRGYDQITIESPNGMRVMQWDDVQTTNGLVSLQMPLSSDPVLGPWVIKVTRGKKETVKLFSVDEYVLPKFEVTVVPPKYLLPTTRQISGTVCAKYTYGKPVKGTVTMEICFSPYYRSPWYPKRPCAFIIEQIDGCHEFFLDSDDIQLGNKNYTSWGTLKINATVEEEATGIKLSGNSDGPGLSKQILSLTLEDDYDGYFKPGFPYKGRVIVKNPDGSPAPGEEIRVIGSSYLSDFEWSRSFTTDENGLVNFVINEIDSDLPGLNLQAEAIVYENDWRISSGFYYFRTWTPSAYLSLTKWFSPSDSYIYIPDIDDAVDCKAELTVDVYYSTPPGTMYDFTALVKAGDRVVFSKMIQKEFDGHVDLNFLSIDENQILEKKARPTLPPLQTLSPLPETETPVIEEEIVPEVFETEVQPIEEELIVPEVASQLGDAPRKKRESKSNLISQFQFTIPISEEMSPNAKIILFYMREDKEIVASTLDFKVNSCFRNKVEMNFEKEKVKPGEDVNLNVKGSPTSTCFVGMVDQSVVLLGGKNYLTPTEVFKNVNRVARPHHYRSWWLEDRDYCEKKKPIPEATQDEYYYSHSRPTGVDATQAFRDAALWVETDGVLETRPCSERRPIRPVTLYSGADGDMDGAYYLKSGDREFSSKNKDRSASPSAEKVEKIRSFFPETWLWDMLELGDDGQLTKQTTIPDTITEWVGNALCTHPADGVGVTELARITAFQPFFVSLTLPYSAVRGEVLPVLVTVFNYLPNCLTMVLTMAETEGFQFSTGAGSSRQFCVCGGETESAKFHIIPSVVGEIDIEVTAMSVADSGLCKNVIVSEEGIGVSDGVQRQLLIEAEGVPQDLTLSSYVCVQDNDIVSEIIDMTLPKDLVPDSERATVSVIGDIMGPTLSNLKNLLRMPYGCGEQNMASWSPNIYVLQYLTNSGQLTDELDTEAKGYMRVGYQRQMKYRHNDHSYSAWGENSFGNATGSLWLTAFVVKTMATSTPFISISPKDITHSADWFVTKQLPDTGCFPQVGKVFSSYMKGGLQDGDNPAGLTAFVLIAMLEGNLQSNPDYQNSISSGFSLCLDSFNLSSLDTYTLTVMSYAYTLYDIASHRRAQILQELESRKRTDGGSVYWSRDNQDKEVEEKRLYCWYRAPSAEVEMTAYVLMSLLAEGPGALGRTLPIVQWITKQRNPYGGFSSTQDTVVALQALAMYASMTYSGSTKVMIEAKNNAGGHMFAVSPSNSLLFQSKSVDPNDGNVTVTTSGSGCAMVQVNLKYNIFKKEDDGPAFDLKVQTYRAKSTYKNCAFRTLRICASYLKPGGASNMAIVEVKMPTGWSPVASTLDMLKSAGKIQKFEIDKNYVELYFDEFTRSKMCVDFDVHQDILMNPKPAMVRVYDYYETQYAVTASYEIKTRCGTKEEIPLNNEGLDCSIMQCRVYPSETESCPFCPSNISKEEFGKLACSSKAVYKADVGRSGKFPAKVQADIRPKKKVLSEVFVNYEIDSSCSCPLLELKHTKALIFTTNAKTLRMKDEKLVLNDEVTLIKFTRKLEKSVRRIASRAKLCQKLERLRRSKKSSGNSGKLMELRSRYWA